MPHIVHTDALVSEGVLTSEQAAIIAARSRDTMLALIINTVLCGGIVAASLGFIFWIADALGVALLGLGFVTLGLAVLVRGGDLYRMLGHAATLIGAGMLIGGGGFEMIDKLGDESHAILAGLGGIIAAGAAYAFRTGPSKAAFSSGAILLMALAAHLIGFLFMVDAYFDRGTLLLGTLPITVFSAYAAIMVAAAGVFLNTRFVTALAIVPFAQMLETGTAYFHAAYVFYSPEPTLTILQMGALTGLAAWAASRLPDRLGRHAGTLSILGATVGSLAFLVGSLWGDHVGMSFARGDRPRWADFENHDAYWRAYDAWAATFFYVSEHVFAVAFAAILIAGAWFAALRHQRGLFNTAMTFLGIHAYTQAFETFRDEPMFYALGGLAAIPLAWGMWRLNARMFGTTSATA